ncbi:flagellar hook-associated protein FlgL [Quadrisphaera sp. INWT6]|uniref:flagellar hook-associated protein FlgL n=1 Tax=Quadrisphaera sp. INWT6 TaxID=2596917 RepID=UPI001891FF77|nr:flagellar hook-associated protein FlgL [Quadrisphaera sp. INWT6]MBF5083147.1 flagellar hook-associated protein 3 [Quadrisphaera sp. INWT6]
MTERVTHRSIQESSLARLQGNLATMGLLQAQISSGKKITKPSDDPAGTVSSLAVRQQLRLNDQYQVQGQDGLSWLNAQDTALQTVSSQLRAARTLVVGALNEGYVTDGTRTATSVELDGIAATVLSLANTQYQGRSIFAGTAGESYAVTMTTAAVTGPGTPPAVTYAPAQYTWAKTGLVADATNPKGTNTPVLRQIDAQSSVRVDTNGADVFGADVVGNGTAASQSVFSLLRQISDEIKTPKDAGTDIAVDQSATPLVPVAKEQRLSTLLGRLDTAMGKVLEGLADVGARTNRIDHAMEIAQSNKYELTDQLSKVEDVDLPAVMIQMSLQETAYKAALQVTSKVLNTSLMDFIR